MATTIQNKNLNVPPLRFPEFTEEWEKCKLGEIAEIKTGPFGSVLHAEDYVDDGIPIITTEHFKIGNLPITKKGLPQVCKKDYNRLSSYRLQKNDIVFSRVGSVDINAHVEEAQEGWLFSGRVLRMRLKSDCNSRFLHWTLSTIKNRNNIIQRAVGQTMPSINTEILNNTEILVTINAIEQSKIAQFLTLIDQRIQTQIRVIDNLESLIKGIRNIIFQGISDWTKLSIYVNRGLVVLNRGNVIPKNEYSLEYCYPVYSSSIQNNGLMGFHNSYMFDKSLISWSIDGGGNFFYRPKHKFNITNVCGIMQVDDSIFDYRFLTEALIYQHQKMTFDYQTKAHPSVIKTIYNIPNVELSKQQEYSLLFNAIYSKIDIEKQLLDKLKEQKKYLLSQMFI